mgnify:CR=1 FL=1
MIRINKNLIIFAGLILLLGTSSLVFLQKLSPLLSHTIYYCQSIIDSLTMPIPYYLGAIPFLLFFIFVLIATVKLLIIYVKVQFLRKKLTRQFKFNTGFNKLLIKLHLTDKTYLIENEKQFAFCLGVRHPKIYVSTGIVSLLTSEELEAVLLHERYHLHNRDALTMLTASIGESLLPFFPLLSDFLRNFRVEREIKADAEAIAGQGSEKHLISVLKKLLNIPSLALAAAAIADRDTLEPRINALTKKDFRFRQFKVKHIFISLTSVFVMSIIALAPVQAVEIHHQGEDAMMICPQNDKCLNACKREYSTDKKNYIEERTYTPVP